MSRVEMDIETECWGSTHKKWIYILGLPMLVIYSIGFPVIVFMILYRNKKRLNEPKIISLYLLLYQGLKSDRYYWELVNTFRKFLLLTLHVFVPDTQRILKSLFGCTTLFTASIMQGRLKPFKIQAISNLEHKEMIASILTLYGGIIFVQEPSQLQALSIIIFVLVVILNVQFWIMWIF